MKKKELTFEEIYEIKLDFVVNEYKCVYAGCGSHKMEIQAEFELEELQELYDKIGKVKGIKQLVK